MKTILVSVVAVALAAGMSQAVVAASPSDATVVKESARDIFSSAQGENRALKKLRKKAIASFGRSVR